MQQLREKFIALSPRERMLVSISVAVGLVVVWFLFVSEPLYNKTRDTQTQLASLKKNLADLQHQRQVLNQRKHDDPHREIKQRLALLDQHMAGVDADLKKKFHGLIEPEQMARVLESVVQQHRDLKLIRVKSLEAVPLLEGDAQGDQPQAEKQVKVYRHGMQVEFEGNFIATLDYLKALEKLDWEFYWDAVQLDVEEYPRSRIIITVHTLSLRDAWIGV